MPLRSRSATRPRAATSGVSQPTNTSSSIRCRRARDEVAQLGGVAVDLGERAADADRVRDRPALDEQPCRRGRIAPAPPSTSRHAGDVPRRTRGPDGIAPSARWSWPESGSAQSTSVATTKRRRSQGEQQRGQEERDEAEQVTGRLADAVRHQAEDGSADERSGTREPECPEPPAREPAREEERQHDDQVVGPDVPGGGGERPVGQPQQPALEVRRRLGHRPERVRVGERRVPRPSWWPTSQNAHPSCRWSPAAASPWPAAGRAR